MANEIITTVRFANSRTLATARIVVGKAKGQFVVKTWLPAGMAWSNTLPEWTDRSETIEAARIAYAKRRDYLKSAGFQMTVA
jgi:hypothetical protein